MTQERTGEARLQYIRPAVEGDQVVGAMRKPGAEREQVASGLEVEVGDTQGSSSAGSEVGAVGGNEIVGEEEFVAGEGVRLPAVGWGNLIDRENIWHTSDKAIVEVHDEQAPLEWFHSDARGDMRVGRDPGSSRVDSEAKKEDHREANEDLCRRITSREKLTCGECVEGVFIDVKPERGRLWV